MGGLKKNCGNLVKITRLPQNTWGPWCKEDLNRLWPWVEKIWALHPYFPELMGKERTLQGAELLK